MDFSIVVPVYNSIESLSILFCEIRTFFSDTNHSFEVIFVNDGSLKQTYHALETIKSGYPDEAIQVIHLPENLGQQKALYVGLLSATGEYAMTLDDDLQHDIKSVKQLFERAGQGSDLIFGIYEEYGESKTRELGSKLIGLFFKLRYPKLDGRRVSSLRLIHRSVYEKLSIHEQPFVYLSAELLMHSQSIDNVKVNRRKRVYGKSGYKLYKCIEIGVKLTVYYGVISWMKIDFKEARPYETIVNGRRG